MKDRHNREHIPADYEEMVEIEYLRQCIADRLEDVTNVRKLRMIYEFVDNRI